MQLIALMIAPVTGNGLFLIQPLVLRRQMWHGTTPENTDYFLVETRAQAAKALLLVAEEEQRRLELDARYPNSNNRSGEWYPEFSLSAGGLSDAKAAAKAEGSFEYDDGSQSDPRGRVCDWPTA